MYNPELNYNCILSCPSNSLSNKEIHFHQVVLLFLLGICSSCRIKGKVRNVKFFLLVHQRSILFIYKISSKVDNKFVFH